MALRGSRLHVMGAAEAEARRRWRTALAAPHLVMVVAGALAFLLGLAVLRDRGATIEVPLLARDVGQGEALAEGDVRLQLLPAAIGNLPEIAELADVKDAIGDGWVVAGALPAGAALRTGDLKPPRAYAAERLMSIDLPPESAVNGDLSPGDAVDVIDADDPAAFAARRVDVLGVETVEAVGRHSVVVVLAVGEEESLAIARAATSGRIVLVRVEGSSDTRSGSDG